MTRYVYICPICEQIIEIADIHTNDVARNVGKEGHLVSHNIQPDEHEKMIQLVQDNLYEWNLTGGVYDEN